MLHSNARASAALLLAIWLCLVSWGCTSIKSRQPARPERPDYSLLTACDLGPDYPTDDVPLREWRPILEQRTFAQTVCASRHRKLAGWAIGVSAKPKP